MVKQIPNSNINVRFTMTDSSSGCSAPSERDQRPFGRSLEASAIAFLVMNRSELPL